MKSLSFCHSFKLSLVYGRFHVGYDTGRCDNRMYILKSNRQKLVAEINNAAKTNTNKQVIN